MSLKCSQCGNQDKDKLLVLEKGIVNTYSIITLKSDGKIEIAGIETGYDNAKYFLQCQKCLHEWSIPYDSLAFA
jgi:hypothetical protein